MPIGKLDIAAGVDDQLGGGLRHADGQIAAAEKGDFLREGQAEAGAGEGKVLGVDERRLVHHGLFNL